MLYPKEDRHNNKLMYACRTCQFSEEASSSCVFRNSLQNTVGETAGVTQDVGSDPTVGLPDFCTLCGEVIQCSVCGGGGGAEQLDFDLMEDETLPKGVVTEHGDQDTENSDAEKYNMVNGKVSNMLLTSMYPAAATVEQTMPQLS